MAELQLTNNNEARSTPAFVSTPQREASLQEEPITRSQVTHGGTNNDETLQNINDLLQPCTESPS